MHAKGPKLWNRKEPSPSRLCGSREPKYLSHHSCLPGCALEGSCRPKQLTAYHSDGDRSPRMSPVTDFHTAPVCQALEEAQNGTTKKNQTNRTCTETQNLHSAKLHGAHVSSALWGHTIGAPSGLPQEVTGLKSGRRGDISLAVVGWVGACLDASWEMLAQFSGILLSGY